LRVNENTNKSKTGADQKNFNVKLSALGCANLTILQLIGFTNKMFYTFVLGNTSELTSKFAVRKATSLSDLMFY